MNEIQFTTMMDFEYEANVLRMMEALYEEDEPASKVDRGRFPITIRTLVADPMRGRVILFMGDRQPRGYALLIPLWSNEFGGTIALIDELFVKPESRNQGIARRFFDFVRSTRPFNAVAAVLEVSPTNARARRLYESVGFARRRNETFTYRF
jgi:ribosomal protein S18 acetylase RimI-like enzyme